MKLPEQVCIKFLDGFPTAFGSFRGHKKAVLCIKRGNGGCLVVIDCFGILLSELVNHLAQLWIWCVRLLCKGRRSKANRQSHNGKQEADLHFSLSALERSVTRI